LNLRPLGYEHYDARLPDPTQSLVCSVTSADEPDVFVFELPPLPRLNLSRRVSCTNPCTKPIGSASDLSLLA
jgi:hypothetical protein